VLQLGKREMFETAQRSSAGAGFHQEVLACTRAVAVRSFDLRWKDVPAETRTIGSRLRCCSLSAAIMTAFGPMSSAGEAPDFRPAPFDAGPRDEAPMPDSTLTTGATGTRGGLLGWAYDSFVDGASVILGYGVRRSSFTFTRKSDGASGTIVDRDYPAYFLIYSTKPSFFENSRFGYTFMVKLSSFDMEQQIATGTLIGGTPTDVHTDVEGIIAYAVPSLYYQWGSIVPQAPSS